MGVSTYLHLPREYNMGLIGLKKYQKIPSFIYVVVHQTFLQKKKTIFHAKKLMRFSRNLMEKLHHFSKLKYLHHTS